MNKTLLLKVGVAGIVLSAVGYFVYKKLKKEKENIITSEEIQKEIDIKNIEKRFNREGDDLIDDSEDIEDPFKDVEGNLLKKPESDPLPSIMVINAYKKDILEGCSVEACKIIANLWDVQIPTDFRFDGQELNVENAELYNEILDNKRQKFSELNKEASKLNFVDFLMWAKDEYLKVYANEKSEAVDNLLIDSGFWDILDDDGEKHYYENLATRILQMDNSTRSFFLPDYKFNSFKEELETWRMEVTK